MACGCNRVYHNTQPAESTARKWDKVIYTTQSPCSSNTADWLSAMQTASGRNCSNERTVIPGCCERRYTLAEIVWLLMHLFHQE